MDDRQWQDTLSDYMKEVEWSNPENIVAVVIKLHFTKDMHLSCLYFFDDDTTFILYYIILYQRQISFHVFS